MIDQQKLAGGYIEASPSSGDYLITRVAKYHRVTPTASGVGAKLPDSRDVSLRTGVELFLVHNASATQNLTLKNNTGSTLNTLSPGQCAFISLASNTNQAGVWARNVRTYRGP